LKDNQINYEQWLWILIDYFHDVPSNLLTSNIYLKELIDLLRQFPEISFKSGLSPHGSNLTILGLSKSEKAF
jgi:hypothetical protein